MAVQSVPSGNEESAGLEILADENWKKLLKLFTAKPRYNTTSIIAHPIT
jgi:hypothetical protein